MTDTPVGYTPPVGPDVFVTLRYDARQQLQPDVRTYGHVGPQWTHDWLAFASEAPAYCEGGVSGTNYCYPARVDVYLRGGGQETFSQPDANGVYPARPSWPFGRFSDAAGRPSGRHPSVLPPSSR